MRLRLGFGGTFECRLNSLEYLELVNNSSTVADACEAEVELSVVHQGMRMKHDGWHVRSLIFISHVVVVERQCTLYAH